MLVMILDKDKRSGELIETMFLEMGGWELKTLVLETWLNLPLHLCTFRPSLVVIKMDEAAELALLTIDAYRKQVNFSIRVVIIAEKPVVREQYAAAESIIAGQSLANPRDFARRMRTELQSARISAQAAATYCL